MRYPALLQRLVLVTLLCSSTACATAWTRWDYARERGVRAQPYSGLQWDFGMLVIGPPDREWIWPMMIGAALDLPVSGVADTALLPVDLVLWLIRGEPD